MARHSTQLEEQYQALANLAESQKRTVPDLIDELIDLGLEHSQDRTAHRREALARLEALRRDLEMRIGSSLRDPIGEIRAIREQQRDEVVRPARER